MPTDTVKVFAESRNKKKSAWLWILPLCLLALCAWFITRHGRHANVATVTPVSDQTKPDRSAGQATTAGWTAASIADSIRQNGRVGFSNDDVHFATGSAALASDSQHVLDNTAQALQANPDWRLRVIGHTDSVGSSAANEQLGSQRAGNVLTYLTAHGIARDRLKVETNGDNHPAATNNRDTGRAENRRVELVKQ